MSEVLWCTIVIIGLVCLYLLIGVIFHLALVEIEESDNSDDAKLTAIFIWPILSVYLFPAIMRETYKRLE